MSTDTQSRSGIWQRVRIHDSCACLQECPRFRFDCEDVSDVHLMTL